VVVVELDGLDDSEVALGLSSAGCMRQKFESAVPIEKNRGHWVGPSERLAGSKREISRKFPGT
jgi:hypothetical protein